LIWMNSVILRIIEWTMMEVPVLNVDHPPDMIDGGFLILSLKFTVSRTRTA